MADLSILQSDSSSVDRAESPPRLLNSSFHLDDEEERNLFESPPSTEFSDEQNGEETQSDSFAKGDLAKSPLRLLKLPFRFKERNLSGTSISESSDQDSGIQESSLSVGRLSDDPEQTDNDSELEPALHPLANFNAIGIPSFDGVIELRRMVTMAVVPVEGPLEKVVFVGRVDVIGTGEFVLNDDMGLLTCLGDSPLVEANAMLEVVGDMRYPQRGPVLLVSRIRRAEIGEMVLHRLSFQYERLKNALAGNGVFFSSFELHDAYGFLRELHWSLRLIILMLSKGEESWLFPQYIGNIAFEVPPEIRI